MHEPLQTYRARWIVPVSTSPIANGWLQTDGRRVLKLAQGPCPIPHVDLGDVAILPQLVNAHTHLEFSHLSGPIGEPGISLSRWIGMVIAARAASVSNEESVRMGIEQSKAAGVSLIGEITTPPCRLDQRPDDPWLAPFAEVLGLSQHRGDERLQAALRHVGLDPWCGLSPHAPYSITRDKILACVQHSRRSGRSIAMHVAESPAERELLTQASGPLHDALEQLGVLREGLFPWGPTPFEWLIEVLGQSSRALLIHANDLRDKEIRLLASHHHLSVVYCPRTHHFFGCDAHPVRRMLDAGVRVAIGTDSLASNPDLSVWGEVQFLLLHRTDLDPAMVLRMATLDGADALGYPRLGRIEIGSDHRLAVIETHATTVDGLYQDWAERELRPLGASGI